MRPEVTRNFLARVPWQGWYTPPEKRRLKRYAAKRSRLSARARLRSVVAGLASLLFVGCSPGDWAAVEAAGQAAKGVACAICGENVGAKEQAAAHSKALREIFEAAARVAETVNKREADRLRAELQALHERERGVAERVIDLAASAKPATVTP